MAHESDGSLMHWTRRWLLCHLCNSDYPQKYGEDNVCPACGRDDLNFDVLEEYYD